MATSNGWRGGAMGVPGGAYMGKPKGVGGFWSNMEAWEGGVASLPLHW